MFVGLPVRGGDYNDGPVYCWKRSIDGISNALAVLCQALQSFETEDVNAQPPDDQDLAAQMEFMTMTSF
jgi:hypothetical protein